MGGDLEHGRLLLEKSPSNLLRGRSLQRLFPGSHFLLVTRHPVVVSLATRKWARSSLPRLLEHWARAHDILGGDLFRIEHARIARKEDLVETGRGLLAEIYASVGLPDAPPADQIGMRGSIMPRMAKYSSAASSPEAGTVTTQAAAILSSAERLTSSLR
jgi:hypothetical protein